MSNRITTLARPMIRPRQLAVVCAIALAALAATTKPGQTEYEFPPQSFKISAPASWEKRPTKDPKVLLMLRADVQHDDGTLMHLFDVIVSDAQKFEPRDLDEFVEGIRKASGKAADAKLSPNEETTLDGARAVRFTYTSKMSNGRPVKRLRVVTISHGKGYLLGYLCEPDQFNAAMPAAQKVLDSFKWTD